MMTKMKKILGKDEDTNIFKAVNKGNENLGGAIAQQMRIIRNSSHK
jgi:hypothetical protein